MNKYLEKIARLLDLGSKLKAVRRIAAGRAHPERLKKPTESLHFESKLARTASKMKRKNGDRVGAIVQRVKSRDLTRLAKQKAQDSMNSWKG